MKKTLIVSIHTDITNANDGMIEAMKTYWRAAFKDDKMNTLTFEIQEEEPLNFLQRINQEFLSDQDSPDEH